MYLPDRLAPRLIIDSQNSTWGLRGMSLASTKISPCASKSKGARRISTAAMANPTADGTAWHAMAVDEVVKRLATDAGQGLDAAEAASRLQKHGPNRLPEGKKWGPFMRFLSQPSTRAIYLIHRWSGTARRSWQVMTPS